MRNGKRRKSAFAALALCVLIMFDVSAAAKQVVGSDGAVANFNPFDTNVPIHVKVLDQSSRYAVDLEFPNMQISFSGAVTWNVNTHKYELSAQNPVTDSFDLKVINHSDQAIAFESSAAPFNQAPLDFTCTTQNDIWRIQGLKSGDGAKFRNITVKATPAANKTWEDVAGHVLPQGTSGQVGTVTVTVRMG